MDRLLTTSCSPCTTTPLVRSPERCGWCFGSRDWSLNPAQSFRVRSRGSRSPLLHRRHELLGARTRLAVSGDVSPGDLAASNEEKKTEEQTHDRPLRRERSGYRPLGIEGAQSPHEE
jgi:hypothetical protein